MASTPDLRTLARGAAAVAAAALLLNFGNGLNPIWPLVWLAWIPVLWFSLSAPWWAAACAGFATTLLSGLHLWSYFVVTLDMPPSLWFAIFAPAALAFAFATLLFRALVLRGAVWSALVFLPSFTVAIEFLRNLTSSGGTAGSLAYSQLSFLPFLQLASVTGPWGMTFVLGWFHCAVALWLHLRTQSPRSARRLLAAGLAVPAAVILFGVLRLAAHQGPTVRVGLIASDIHGNANVVDPGPETVRLFGDYARAASGLIAQGAQAIVIPEKLGVVFQTSPAGADGILQSLSNTSGVTIVAGAVVVDGPAEYNEARIYSPGRPIERYHKQHMLPPFESNLKPGTNLALLPRDGQLWGVAICKDMDFASPARRYGQAGAGLLLVPAWDFVVDAGWHGHIAVMRGVEDGFSIARAAKTGFLTVSDDRGRILGERRSNAAPFATLLVDAPVTHHATLYQSLGDWFAWVAVLLFVLSLAQCIRLQCARK